MLMIFLELIFIGIVIGIIGYFGYFIWQDIQSNKEMSEFRSQLEYRNKVFETLSEKTAHYNSIGLDETQFVKTCICVPYISKLLNEDGHQKPENISQVRTSEQAILYLYQISETDFIKKGYKIGH